MLVDTGNIQSYIKSAPEEVQEKLYIIYKLIKSLVPEAEESINYGMPTFKIYGKNLIHFAFFKKHIGFYPTPSPIEKYKEKLKNYKYSKGAIQFPHEKELPLDLIKNITLERIKEFRKI